MYANVHPNWPKLLAVNRMTFRMSPATQFSQYSPYGLVFGKQMRLPIDTSLSPNTTVSKDLNLEKKISSLSTRKCVKKLFISNPECNNKNQQESKEVSEHNYAG